jgi:hypothetical protein
MASIAPIRLEHGINSSQDNTKSGTDLDNHRNQYHVFIRKAPTLTPTCDRNLLPGTAALCPKMLFHYVQTVSMRDAQSMH